jgi:predicted DNA-binding transcriptional regulator YafY
MKEVSSDTLKTFEVKVVLAKQNRYFLEEHHQIVKKIESQAEGLLVTFDIGDRAWLLRELISIGGAVRVISPIEFKDDFERKVSEIMALYGESV